MAQLDNNLALMRLTGMQLRHDCVSACRTCAIDKGKKDKGRVKVYSAFTAGLYRLTFKALRYGSQFYLQITPYLPLPRKSSPDGAGI